MSSAAAICMRRGRISTAPGGYGTINKYGRRSIYYGRRRVQEHVLVWEMANGKIPHGMQIWFADGDKLNTSLANLELRSFRDCNRLSRGWVVDRDGRWCKVCCVCGELQGLEQYHLVAKTGKPTGPCCWCRMRASENRADARARQKS